MKNSKKTQANNTGGLVNYVRINNEWGQNFGDFIEFASILEDGGLVDYFRTADNVPLDSMFIGDVRFYIVYSAYRDKFSEVMFVAPDVGPVASTELIKILKGMYGGDSIFGAFYSKTFDGSYIWWKGNVGIVYGHNKIRDTAALIYQYWPIVRGYRSEP